VISHNNLIEIYLLVLLLLCYNQGIECYSIEMGYIFQLIARQACTIAYSIQKKARKKNLKK